MRTGRPRAPLSLAVEEREALERWARRPKSAQALAQRARRVGMRGRPAQHCSRPASGADPPDRRQMAPAFLARRLDGLLDEPRPGGPHQVGDTQIERVVRLTLESAPADATHWSTRAMAKRCGLSQSMVSRIWRAFALQPHRVEGFKLSKDLLFIEKLRDIVGLYLNPPERALVLCVDEKSQIQALDRSQPVLPMRRGQAERRTPDYLRHGQSVRGARLQSRHRDRVVASAASGYRVSQVPPDHRRHRAARARTPFDSITTQPTRPRRSSAGCCAIPASTCTSRRPALPGSTWSSAGSRR